MEARDPRAEAGIGSATSHRFSRTSSQLIPSRHQQQKPRLLVGAKVGRGLCAVKSGKQRHAAGFHPGLSGQQGALGTARGMARGPWAQGLQRYGRCQ